MTQDPPPWRSAPSVELVDERALRTPRTRTGTVFELGPARMRGAAFNSSQSAVAE